MKIQFSPYEIQPLAPLNSLSQIQVKKTHVRTGALLKIEFEKGVVGYADIHPWVELGDRPLAEQLYSLCVGELTDLTRKSIGFAGIDAKARQEGVNLLAGVEIPESHALILEPLVLKLEHIDALFQKGYRFAKCKMGVDLEKELQHLNDLAKHEWKEQSGERLKLRLDFNASHSAKDVKEKFISKISNKLKDKIDFIEDPCKYDFTSWQDFRQQGFVLAYDRKEDGLPIGEVAADILIYKPAIEDGAELEEYCHLHGKKIFITSYMDHPVGQMFSAIEAVKYKEKDQERKEKILHGAGLLSHLVYEKNEFSSLLTVQGSRFVINDGLGIGFDKLLEQRTWLDISRR